MQSPEFDTEWLPQLLSTGSLSQDLPLNLDVTDSTRIPGHGAPGISPSPHPQI